jgi:hypothetical protein
MASNGSQLASSLRNSFARKPRTETEQQLESMQEKLLPHTRVQGVRLFVQQVREERPGGWQSFRSAHSIHSTRSCKLWSGRTTS